MNSVSAKWSGQVGSQRIEWLSIPQGNEGHASVMVDGQGPWTISWKRDGEGILVELPSGVQVLNWMRERNDDGVPTVTLTERVGSRVWRDLRWMNAGEAEAGAAQQSQQKKKGTRVRAQMPGKIVRVMVKVGQEIQKDQPLIVMEAMKMENEIRALGMGRVKEVKVVEGQAVDSGADLLILE